MSLLYVVVLIVLGLMAKLAEIAYLKLMLSEEYSSQGTKPILKYVLSTLNLIIA